MKKIAAVLGAFLALALSAGVSEAALIQMELKSVIVYGTTPRTLNISASTATWAYDDVGRELIQTGGIYSAAWKLGPPATIYTHVITGLKLDFTTPTSTSFDCVEGNYGALVGNNYCGGYSFGGNFVDESTTSFSPFVQQSSRTLGGDDYAFGGVSDLAVYEGFRPLSWDGTTLVFSNGQCFGGADCTGLLDGFNGNFRFELQATAVPAPASAWLLGTGIAFVGMMRRRKR